MNLNNQSLKKTQEQIDSIENKEKNKVMFFDEGRFGLRSTTMRIWAEKGKIATVKVMQGFKNLDMVTKYRFIIFVINCYTNIMSYYEMSKMYFRISC
jgi:hypothetical protein